MNAIESEKQYEKNLYITYLDEVICCDYKGYSFKSIVSMSMKKDYYINIIENKWHQLREKYSIPNGVCLHFTDIKALLNPCYFTRDPNDPKERNLDIESIFCDNDKVNKDKLYSFYKDILYIIDDCVFNIVITGITQYKNYEYNQHKKQLQSEWYVLFKNHLDNLAEFMMYASHLYLKNNRYYTTKLRFDGDNNLAPRDTFRNAYAEIISNGTLRFSRDYSRECFDSLKFVGKNEVGFSDRISHAGNELLDFIALYASKNFFKDIIVENYNKYTNGNIKNFDKQLKIYIDSREIYPYESIEKKIYKQKFINLD